MLSHHPVGDEQDDIGNEGDQHEQCQQHHDHGQYLLGYLHERGVGDAGGDEQQEPEGRGGQADHHVQADQHTEVDHVYAQHPHDGYHHGQEHELQYRGVQEHAEDQKQGVYPQQQQVLVGGQTQHELRDHGGDILLGHDIGEYGCRSGEDRDLSGADDRVLQRQQQRLEAEDPVGEQGDDQRIEGGDGSRFGGGHDAGVDSHQQDHGSKEGGKGLHGELDEFDECECLAPGIIAFARYVPDVDAQHQGEQDTGHHAAEEQGTDRGSREHGVDDEGDAWGEDRADGCRCGGDRAAERFVVAVLDHRFDLHLADARGVRDSRAGHAAEDQRYDHVHIRQGPAASTDEGFGEGEHGVGHLARVHHVRGEDEQRYGHEHIAGVQCSHCLSDDQSDIATGVEQVVDTRGQHAVGDGYVEQEGQHQHADRNPQR